MAMYASVRKNAMMSIGKMLPVPTVPPRTSSLPMAEMASRNRSAMSGAYRRLARAYGSPRILSYSDKVQRHLKQDKMPSRARENEATLRVIFSTFFFGSKNAYSA